MKSSKFDSKPALIALAGGALAAVLLLLGVFAPSQRQLQDRFYAVRSPQPDIVIVAIDDASLQTVGKWPWDRQTVASLVRALAPAKIVGLDVNFPDYSTVPGADQDLIDALRAAGNVVLPIEISYLSDGQTVAATTAPVPPVADAAVDLAHTSITPDVDGMVRRLPLTVTAKDGKTYHAFGEIVARRAGARPENVPTDTQGRLLVSFAGAPGHFRSVSAADVLSGAVPSESFRDQVVFVGGTSSVFRDEYRAPTATGALMSGVEIHANLADSFLANNYLRDLPNGYGALICLLIALIVGIVIPLVRVRTGLIVLVGLVIAVLASVAIGARFGVFIPFVNPLIALALAYMAVTVYRYIKANSDRRELRTAFEKYVAPSVIKTVMAHPENLVLGGERRRMSVLFADLRGFTSITERMDPAEMVRALNGYFNAMTDIVFEEHGVLDKYMGDAIMAFWGAPVEDEHHAMRAIRTAIRMRDHLAEMNRVAFFGPNVALRAGVGISTGEMVVGNMGSHRHFDYTVLGDNVNLGSRIESLTKDYGVDILATEESVRGLPKDYVVRQLDKVAVKGKTEPVRLYEVVGFAGAITPEIRDKHDRFARALSLYERDDFHGASLAFADILALFPNDGPAHVFWQRSNYFMQDPPAPDWKGVWVMRTK